MAQAVQNISPVTPPIDALNVSMTGTQFSVDRILLVSARSLIALIFVVSGIMKIFGWAQTIQYMTSKGMPAPEFLLFVATLLEIGCGLLIAFGRRVRISSGLLFLYLIPTTLIFHNFWDLSGMEQQNQMGHFMKNLAIMGGLLCLFLMDKFFNNRDVWAYRANEQAREKVPTALKGDDF
jgi:putative oxidoreductase